MNAQEAFPYIAIAVLIGIIVGIIFGQMRRADEGATLLSAIRDGVTAFIGGTALILALMTAVGVFSGVARDTADKSYERCRVMRIDAAGTFNVAEKH